MVVKCVDQDNRAVGGGRLLSTSCGLRLGQPQRVELGALGHPTNKLALSYLIFVFIFWVGVGT